jgi:hypothetical protein
MCVWIWPRFVFAQFVASLFLRIHKLESGSVVILVLVLVVVLVADFFSFLEFPGGGPCVLGSGLDSGVSGASPSCSCHVLAVFSPCSPYCSVLALFIPRLALFLPHPALFPCLCT